MNFCQYLFTVITAGLLFVSCSSSKSVNSKPESTIPDTFAFDEQGAIDRLSRAVQFPTVSNEDTSETDHDVYDAFYEFLIEQYPGLYETAQPMRIGGYSVLYKWEGTRADLRPALLMGHFDVVPVREETNESWAYPPFGGDVEEGFVWGRGTLDDKSGIMSILEAAEFLTEQDFQPERTLYIALHHDEEVGGLRGAKQISEYLEKQGVQLEYLVDEGSPIAEEIIDRIDVPLAMIGVAEKGSVNIELTYRQEGGHSSMPPRQSVISTLSRAVNRIERRPMRGYYRGLIVETFEPLIPYMSFTQRLAFNNTWLFRGIIRWKLGQNPATNAALRTTAAKTIFEAGFKENVLPVDGRVIINFRLHPNNTIEDVVEYVRRTIRNSDIEIRVMERARNPSPVSDTRTRSYQMLEQTIEESFENVLVSPSLFVAASDSRHFHNLTSNIYRFRPIRATHDDRARVHGIDERIRISNYLEMIQFQLQLIRNGSAAL